MLAANRPNGKLRAALAVLVCLLTTSACTKKLHREFTDPRSRESLDEESPYLKAHMRDGTVYVLKRWHAGEREVRGSGSHLDPNRVLLREGWHEFPLDSVAIFETNRLSTSPAAMAMAILTTVSLGATVHCLQNEKACFGSCPTFYARDGERFSLQAEGFSHSISPSLEARDLDALYRAQPVGRRFTLRMTNEALETHVVREANLLIAPRPPDSRVFATQTGQFLRVGAITRPTLCQAAEGDCRVAVEALDGRERYSSADTTDLATRESIELEFAPLPSGQLGLVIASRQTLMSTYLFYQTLAYLGESAGAWFAVLERGDASLRDRAASIGRLLGGIDVMVQDDAGRWRQVGYSWETGPLASDLRVVPLPALESRSDPSLKVRLRMAKGLWRLDWVALAQLQDTVTPIRLPPSQVRTDGREDSDARARLIDKDAALVTFPGDTYDLIYELPRESTSYEFFLESRGYYLEWMRKEWLREEDPKRAAMIFFDPAGALKVLAPEYTRVEPQLEHVFWRSRYVRP